MAQNFARIVFLTVVSALSCSGTANADLLISGIESRLEANVRALSPLATTACESAPWRVERLFRDADKSVRQALQALGYYEPSIKKSLRWSEDCWHASFEIEAGEPVRLGAVDVRIEGAAADDERFADHVAAARPAPGDILDHGLYESYKASMMRAAMASGFFDAEFLRTEVVVEPRTRSAELALHLQSGTQYQFGEVTFTPGIVRDSLLRGYSDIVPGSPYSSTLVNELYEALGGSNYFATVSISTDPLDTEQKIVPVSVELTPGKRRVYTIGAGVATDTGPQGRLGYSDRRLNEKGHQLETKLFASSVRSELTGSYRWPKKDPRREWMSVFAGVQHENTDTSRSDTFTVGILRARNLGKRWLDTRYLDYSYEDYTVGEQATTSQLIILGNTWESAEGRELGRVSNGRRLSFDVRGASDSLGSDTSFLQFRAKTKWIHSLGGHYRAIARANLGLTIKDDFSELPASVRFFAGGDRSVRGYDYESLGPVDENGDVIGGSYLLDGSVEIDRLLGEKWTIAAFVDSGSAFNDSEIEFSTGAGIGIRWYSPLGPLRLDVAHPFDDPDNDYRIHISLGPDL
ncbi:BamA/TamA family outer membrane protein [Gammaproteobacteria bacterium]|nr:BamA/TamA family outer membrane protein [Gammaproteobacteria bacterium]